MSVGCSPAVAGRKGDGEQTDPADPSLQLWEGETEMWPVVGSWLPMGPDGFAQGAGARMGERSRQGWVVNLGVCLLCSAGLVGQTWLLHGTQLCWHLAWWCLTWGSVVPSCVVPEMLVLELAQTEATGENWGFWGGC